jgi:hypothetical protein
MKTHVIRKYQCSEHSYFDELVKWSERFEPQKCPKCQRKCESVFIKTRSALPGATIVYEKMVGGKVERMYVDPQVPESCVHAEKQGFQRREIQGMAQARAFEKEVANEMRRDFASQQNAMSRQKEEAMREAHSEIRRLMPQMDDFSREIAEEAIRDSQSGYSQSYDPNFRIGAYN